MDAFVEKGYNFRKTLVVDHVGDALSEHVIDTPGDKVANGVAGLVALQNTLNMLGEL